MSLAEAVATALTSWLALLVAVAYGFDALGFRLSPAIVGLLALGAVALGWGGVIRRATRNMGELVGWLLIVTLFLAWLLGLAWPALLPPGRGPDLTHHLLLVDFIEHNQRLPFGLGLEGAMGEMAHYTPGLHLLAVLAGAWTGTDGFRAIYFVVSLSAALTMGFVFLIAIRVLPATSSRIPIALAGVVLVAGVRSYVADAFVHDSFLAQAVSALFAVASWWAVTAWDDEPSASAAAVLSLTAVGVFLTWPVWIGPPLFTFLLLVLTRHEWPWYSRVRTLLVSLAPVAVAAIVHAAGSARWAQLVRSSGAALTPSTSTLGWLFPVLALLGFPFAFTNRRVRSTLLMLAAIAAQGVVLYVMAKSIGAETPYMALKMMYLAVYPLAVLAAIAMGKGSEIVGGSARVVAWVACAAVAVMTVRPMLAAQRPTPVVSRDFYDAGQWVRAHVGTTCVDYLVEDSQTAYWLHLAVLGNPRASQRSAEVDRHNMRAAFARWIPAEGLPYAIADLTLLPDEIRSRVELVKQFGKAGVIKRPNGAACQAE
jgi:hypothetical protein